MSRHESADLLQGTLDMLILKVAALEPIHGYAIVQRLQQISKDALQIRQGSLYPALYRLENRGWLKAEWKTTEAGREAKFYSPHARRPPPARIRNRRLEAPLRRHLARTGDTRMKFPFGRRNWERSMDTELRFHLDQQIRDYMDRGLSRAEAERRARQEFGTLELAKDECRDQRSSEWLDHILRDLRHACRSLRKSPGFAAAVVATLALGIGANTAIFSLIYSVLLKPLPYPAADRIFSVETLLPRQNAVSSLPMRVQDYLEWRQASTAFESLAALTPAQWNLTGDGEPERLGGALVSANFFTFLGASPERGRGFSAAEETPGKQNVVVISDSLWRRRYGADPAIIGKTILLNAVPRVVVGIAPPSLLVPTGTALHPTLAFAPAIDVWQPIAPTHEELQGENWNYGILVRLREGESAERGRQQLQALLNRSIRAAVPEFTGELTVRLVPVRDIYSSKVRLRLLLIFAASGLLLLIACTNIANLFLARVAGRATEMATRIALGAGRARIVSHLLMESLLLSVLGGAVGAWAAHSGAGLLIAYGPAELGNLALPGLNLAGPRLRPRRQRGHRRRLRRIARVSDLAQGRGRRSARGRPSRARRARRHPPPPGAGGRSDDARRRPACLRRAVTAQLRQRHGHGSRLQRRAHPFGGSRPLRCALCSRTAPRRIFP